MIQYNYTIESDMGDEQLILLLLNILIIVLSSFIVGSAYKSHLRRFSADMAVLRSYGAERRQIQAIFRAEFVVVFALSAISALALSAGGMKLLFMSFLEITGDGFAWIIFKMNPMNTALHIAIFFVVLFAVITITLAKFAKESMAGAAKSDVQVSAMRKRHRKLKIKSTPERSLMALWRQRTSKTHRSCLFVAIPLMTVFLFLFAYLSLNAEMGSSSRPYELIMMKSPVYNGFTQEELAAIEGLSQVKEIQIRRDLADQSFYAEPDGAYRIDIYLTSRNLHSETEAQLRQLFPYSDYKITNFEAEAEQGRKLEKGIYIMLLFIFSAMLVFMVVIVGIKLSDYISDSSKTIKSLSTIGASNDMIKDSYVRQSAVSAVIAVILPTIASITLFLLSTRTTTQRPSVNLSLVSTYLVAGAAIVGTFILPVYLSVQTILKRKGNIR